MLTLFNLVVQLGVLLWLLVDNTRLRRSLYERTVERDTALQALSEFAHLSMTFHHERHWFDTTSRAFVSNEAAPRQ